MKKTVTVLLTVALLFALAVPCFAIDSYESLATQFYYPGVPIYADDFSDAGAHTYTQANYSATVSDGKLSLSNTSGGINAYLLPDAPALSTETKLTVAFSFSVSSVATYKQIFSAFGATDASNFFAAGYSTGTATNAQQWWGQIKNAAADGTVRNYLYHTTTADQATLFQFSTGKQYVMVAGIEVGKEPVIMLYEDGYLLPFYGKSGSTTYDFANNVSLAGALGICVGASYSIDLDWVKIYDDVNVGSGYEASPSKVTVFPERGLQITDSADVVYTPGTVLHNMDFSQVSSFAQTGYSFVTNDPGLKYMGIAGGAWRVKFAQSNWSTALFTGNGIPQNIQNYTMSVRFRFSTFGASDTAFRIVHKSLVVGMDNGVYSTIITRAVSDGSITLGTIANSANVTGSKQMTSDKTATKNALSSTAAGYVTGNTWVTAVCSYADGYLEKIIFVFDDGEASHVGNALWTETVTVPAATVAADGYHGIQFVGGKILNLEFSNVQFVAGSVDEQPANLIWPEAESALVRSVKSPVKVAGYQKKTTGDKMDIRVVGSIDFEELSAWAKVGFKVSVHKDGATDEQNAAATDLILSGTQVYTSILADGLPVTPTDLGLSCDYLSAIEIRNFSTTGTYSVTLTPFAEKSDGTRIYSYEGASSFTVTNGVISTGVSDLS